MLEIEIVSNDKITYKGKIEDLIQLSKEQRSKLKFLTLVANSSMIEKEGVEFGIEERQAKAILKTIQKNIGKNRMLDITKEVKELIEKRIVLFRSLTQYNHQPDPHRICIQRKVALERLIATGKILKVIARFNPEDKEIHRHLAYQTESRIDSGKLLISFSQDQYIILLKANINEGEKTSPLCAELLEMIDHTPFDYTLAETECSCGGEASPILTDVTYRLDPQDIVVESVPVLICSKCGELYNDALIGIRSELQAYKAMQANKNRIEF